MRALIAVSAAALFLNACGCNRQPQTSRARSFLVVDPSSLDFGTVTTGTTQTQTVRLTNTGDAPATVQFITIVDDTRMTFSTDGAAADIPSGGLIEVRVTYRAPASEGVDGARLLVESNADNAPQLSVALGARAFNPCAAGLSSCGSTCVNVQTDSSNCGTCGSSCATSLRCIGGECRCVPKTCLDIGTCGTADDGCGGTLQCGTCGQLDECRSNQCVPPTCLDMRKNGAETDVDCGGAVCPKCMLTQTCSQRSDCAAGLVCSNGVCAACTASSQCASSQVCTAGRCGACTADAECGANAACVSGACVRCPTEAPFNACGVCAGLPITGLGVSCVNAAGCTSNFICNSTGTGVECLGATKNECGLCGGSTVSDLDAGCTSVEGCAGVNTCASSGVATTCSAPVKNTCGLCGGPPISGLNSSCVNDAGCGGQFACNTSGDGITCAGPARNGCGVCGGPSLALDAGCTDVAGCNGVTVCDGTGNGLNCAAPPKNECGLCGGGPITGLDGGCTGTNGCGGRLACNDAGTGTYCEAPAVCNLGTGIVISQLSGGWTASDDEFIELYNPTESSRYVDGLSLWYRADDNTTSWLTIHKMVTTQPLAALMQPRSYFLIASTAFATAHPDIVPDATYSTTTSINMSQSNGQLLLWSDTAAPTPSTFLSSTNKVDFVGYGANAERWEGYPDAGPAPTLSQGKSIVRKATAVSTSATMSDGGADSLLGNGIDTNNNAADFVLPTSAPNPRNSQSPFRP